MKVGIVTIYDNFNHGNRLQNFALEKAILGLGHEVESLLITSKKIYVPLLAIAKIVGFIPTMRRISAGKKFSKNQMNCRYVDFVSHKKLLQSEKEFDCFVLGSDQVFNPAYIADDFITFLKFAPQEKRLSYAASFGVEKLPNNQEERFKNALNAFAHISVREEEGAVLVKSLTGKDAEVVVDPTMLLSKEEWEEEIAKTQIELPKQKYLLTYFLGTNKTYKKQAKELAKKHGLEFINLNSPTCKYHSCDPMQFMALIKNAALVCTNSFHGHALSIILEKPFVSFGAFSSTKSRIRNLLSLVKLEGRSFESVKEQEVFAIDYSFAREKMKKERERCLSSLKQSIDKTQKN